MDLSNANLAGVNLRRAYLNGVDFSGADLSYADLRATEVYGTNFSGALLKGALINGANPEVQLIVINMKTGGLGFTLTASSNVVFCEMGWTPADHLQAEDRCHRIGQIDVVNSWYLLAPDSIDMDIYEAVMVEKLQVVTDTTKGNEELRVETISVLERLSQLFEARMKKKKEEHLDAKENKLEIKPR